MANRDDVRRVALSLPETTEEAASFRFFVAGKAFPWAWLERVDPKRARVQNRDVVAVSVGNELEKEALIEVDPAAFFTEPHYDGYPAILVRLPPIDPDLLQLILTDAWRIRAPKRLLTRLAADAERPA